MSRPEIPIDWKKVDELLMAGCLGTEVAAYFCMHHQTFYDRVEREFGTTFTAYSQEKKQKGESLLRAHQYAKALGLTEKGDNTLLIWLGKTRLNQREADSHIPQQTITLQAHSDLTIGISTKKVPDPVDPSPELGD